MNIKYYLKNLKDRIDKSLDEYLPSEKAYPKAIHWAMRYSVFSGGKRMRPILAIESCKVCKGRLKDVLPAACAIELIHTYSLIHDDLPAMDDDDYRRGRPTSHKVFGEANAILAGDALLALAFNIIAKEANGRRGLEVIRELSEAIGTRGMVGGQIVDLEFKNKKLDKKTLNYINRFKTSRLFEASTKIGAIAAQSSKKEK
ncbi:MAG: polyprenyl synthetase family protein, partial [Candidatus Omnitrophica bacterium]|nr:polyprenyl synthetase family protein [Candidatus Omnitrophota bacterium]